VPLAAFVRRLRQAFAPAGGAPPLAEPQWDVIADVVADIDALLKPQAPAAPAAAGAAAHSGGGGGITTPAAALPAPLQAELAAARAALANRDLAAQLASALGASLPRPVHLPSALTAAAAVGASESPAAAAVSAQGLRCEGLDVSGLDRALEAGRELKLRVGCTREVDALLSTARTVRLLRAAALAGAWGIVANVLSAADPAASVDAAQGHLVVLLQQQAEQSSASAAAVFLHPQAPAATIGGCYFASAAAASSGDLGSLLAPLSFPELTLYGAEADRQAVRALLETGCRTGAVHRLASGAVVLAGADAAPLQAALSTVDRLCEHVKSAAASGGASLGLPPETQKVCSRASSCALFLRRMHFL
jgi:hypothetical protein